VQLAVGVEKVENAAQETFAQNPNDRHIPARPAKLENKLVRTVTSSAGLS
jgi:hypothetical protein